jgi:hypothetical protein
MFLTRYMHPESGDVNRPLRHLRREAYSARSYGKLHSVFFRGGRDSYCAHHEFGDSDLNCQ